MHNLLAILRCIVAPLSVFVLWLGNSVASASPLRMDLTIHPTAITIEDDIIATFEFGSEGSFGFKAGSTYDISVNRAFSDITISIVAASPPPPGPGEYELTGFHIPRFEVPIGRLPSGGYRLLATLDLDGSTTNSIGFGETNFSVIPEPTSALLIGLGMAAVVVGRRRTRTFAAGERGR